MFAHWFVRKYRSFQTIRSVKYQGQLIILPIPARGPVFAHSDFAHSAQLSLLLRPYKPSKSTPVTYRILVISHKREAVKYGGLVINHQAVRIF